MLEFRLLPPRKLGLRTSVMAGSYRHYGTECLTLQDRTDRLSRNVGNHLSINAA